MEHSHENWFGDEIFWERTFPFMFPEKRFVAAAESVLKIASLAEIQSGSVLDLACGPGRFAVPFAKAGYSVTGVDSTPFLLEKARQLAAREAVRVEWVEQDMRQFLRPNAFDLAINLFTSFGYFDEASDNQRVLQNIYASLKPGGVFVFDHLGKEILAARFQPTVSEASADGSVIIQRVSVIDDWSRVKGEWTIIEGGRATSFHNCHWLYSGHEIRELLASVGFVEIALYGTLEKAPYGPEAERLIAVAKKLELERR